MIYLSAGHHFKAPKADPGAVGSGYKEADLTRELRGLVAAYLTRLGASYILDKDSENLDDYLKRIKPGSGSVVCELHFNASANARSTGGEVIHKDGADANARALAGSIALHISETLGIKNRGAKPETVSPHKRLAVLHTVAGISVLPEICFITNAKDIASYQLNKDFLAERIALALKAADDLRT